MVILSILSLLEAKVVRTISVSASMVAAANNKKNNGPCPSDLQCIRQLVGLRGYSHDMLAAASVPLSSKP